jgi:DNA/RNA-binding domain of Phe-tRNA-synthetase-like protein
VSAGEPVLGWVAEDVRADLPELRLWSQVVQATPGRSDASLKARLRALSDRFHGAKAVAMRRDPVPQAYRVLFRHVGLDPDADRTPIEAAVLERLVRGGFASTGRLPDALTIGLVETGVPVWALDAAAVEGPLGIGLHAGRIVVADAAGPVCDLFGPIAPEREVTPETTAMLLFTVQPAGVPAIHVEEALWLVAEALDA